MASAAEQLASNLNWGAIGKATELKKRLWFTIGALVVFRIGAYIPVPGVDPVALAEMFHRNAGGIAGMLDVFSGGSIGRMSILALSIMPYISASIIMQILTTVVPSLEALKKEGEAGRKKINQYTRYGTVVLAAFQAYGISVGLESQTSSVGPVVHDPGLFFRFVTIVTLVGGTLLLMWIGEQITARGVGNGTSLVIFAQPDDDMSQPEGNAGQRIACGPIVAGVPSTTSSFPALATASASTRGADLLPTAMIVVMGGLLIAGGVLLRRQA